MHEVLELERSLWHVVSLAPFFETSDVAGERKKQVSLFLLLIKGKNDRLTIEFASLVSKMRSFDA